MRILHTSDWHFGQYFMGKSRQSEHEALIAWLVEQTRALDIDAVILAGDVFDTGAPPSYARELYNRLIVAMRDAGVSLIVLAGNHDSVATMQESRALLACLNTVVIPCVDTDLAQQVQVLVDRNGAPGAIVCAVPFIRPRDVVQSAAGQSVQDKQQSLQDAIRAHYAAVHALAVQKREMLGLPLPIVATGHLTTVGASASESVREIYVGSLEAFPTAAFPPADYIALGHIHRPQRVGGLDHIRYCGSPIPLGFDEARQQKEMLVVEFAHGALACVTPVPVPCFQPLVSIRGDLKALAAGMPGVAAQAQPGQTVWLEVVVAEDDYLSDLQTRIEALTDGLPVEVLRIRRERGTASAVLRGDAKQTLDELSPDDVFARRLDLETLDEPVHAQVTSLYRAVVAEVRGGDESRDRTGSAGGARA
ncbi:MAG TPA: exonuclease subunit SbcD [Pararobbsia sp.]|nr:exonuclease subunit SbcD [Pararobbsia sp.]